MKSIPTLILVAGVSLMATGCVAQERVVVRTPAARSVVVVKDAPRSNQQVIIVKKRPPAPRREVRSHRPSRRHVWVPGHWEWRRSKYVWVRGHWAVPPRAGSVWVAGHWSKHADGWVFAAGFWR